MEVWKIIFLSKWGIGRFHVNLPGCCDASHFVLGIQKPFVFSGVPTTVFPTYMMKDRIDPGAQMDRSRQRSAAHFAWPRSCKRKWRRCGSKVVKQHTLLEHTPSNLLPTGYESRDSSNIVGERGIDSKGVL